MAGSELGGTVRPEGSREQVPVIVVVADLPEEGSRPGRRTDARSRPVGLSQLHILKRRVGCDFLREITRALHHLPGDGMLDFLSDQKTEIVFVRAECVIQRVRPKILGPPFVGDFGYGKIVVVPSLRGDVSVEAVVVRELQREASFPAR